MLKKQKLEKAKQIKTPSTNKKRFFDQKTKQQKKTEDIEHLQNWARRIQAWIDHVENKLRKMETLPAVLQDAERNNIFLNHHVTMMYRPSEDELSALIHLSAKYAFILQEIQGFLKYTDNCYDRMVKEGAEAGEDLINAIDELKEAIIATIEGMKEKVLELKEDQSSSERNNKKKTIRNQFTFEQGQVCFDGKDLDLPTGLTIEVFEKLYKSWCKPVPYKVLDMNSETKTASEQLKKAKFNIKNSFEKNKVPCVIKNKRKEAYLISEKNMSKVSNF